MTNSDTPRVLVADDQPDVLEALRLLLKGHGYETEAVTSPNAVLAALDKRDYDALLLDMRACAKPGNASSGERRPRGGRE